MTQPAPDGDLPGTLRHLGDAVSRLVDPKPQTVGGSIHWAESFYQQLCDAIPGTQGTRSAVPQSSPPLNLDASELKQEIDSGAARWIPKPHIDGADINPPWITVLRLHELEKQKLRPQDCSLLESMTERISGWVVQIHRLLYPEPQWTLPNCCPACNVAVVHRRNSAGEVVRQPALQIGANGCKCLSCHAEWGPALFQHLANVLGYELPTGVLE